MYLLMISNCAFELMAPISVFLSMGSPTIKVSSLSFNLRTTSTLNATAFTGQTLLATGLPEFKAYFNEHHVQLALEKGDAAFFNPALFHGAGTNRTSDARRMANLLQISSALGRAMESVDRTAMVLALYPVLLDSDMDADGVGRVLAASAEGYPFPGDLDRNRPAGESADQSPTDIALRAVRERWPADELASRLAAR